MYSNIDILYVRVRPQVSKTSFLNLLSIWLLVMGTFSILMLHIREMAALVKHRPAAVHIFAFLFFFFLSPPVLLQGLE
jgi:hypothetical protein